MAYMKSLTVSGQTYQVKDPEAVDFSKVQSLTPAQQAQARENIGATTETHIVDKLCASFTESGSMVTCEPVEGYPLEVTAEEGATITRCGKNLAQYPYSHTTRTGNGITFTDNGDGTITANGTATGNAVFNLGDRSTWALKPGADYTASIKVVSGTVTGTPSLVVNYFKPGASGSNYNPWLTANIKQVHTKPCPDDYYSVRCYILVPSGVACADLVLSVQLEPGTVATEHEQYKDMETFAPGEAITANPGVNTIFADAGLVTVKGKTDPVAIINKLTNAILSLGGNV